jgi:hypothetical protein
VLLLSHRYGWIAVVMEASATPTPPAKERHVMDRFTWVFVGGAVAACVVGIASTFYVRAAPSPPQDTPSGVVTAYVQAVHDHDADSAWQHLAPGATVGLAPTTEDAFHRSVVAPRPGGTGYSRLVRIAGMSQNAGNASVAVEVSTGEGIGPQDTRELTFELKRIDGVWKIISCPSTYEIA